MLSGKYRMRRSLTSRPSPNRHQLPDKANTGAVLSGFDSHSLRHIAFLQPESGPPQQVDVNPVRSGRKQR